MATMSDTVNDLREQTLPDYSEQISPTLQADLEREQERWDGLREWRENTYPVLVRGRPGPAGDSR
jgi:hypothetical protein